MTRNKANSSKVRNHRTRGDSETPRSNKARYIAPEAPNNYKSNSPKFELRSSFQRTVVKEIKENYITALIGLAGTSKTLLATYVGWQLLNSHESPIEKIIVVRLAADTMGESIGALPGSLEDKLNHITAPILDNLSLFTKPMEAERAIEEKRIEIIPVSHLRGRSLQNAFIIVEEVQNLNRNMILTVMTRISNGSKMVFTGDPAQADFSGRNGTVFLRAMLEDIEGCAVLNMPSTEIYRHPILSSLLTRAEALRVPYVSCKSDS